MSFSYYLEESINEGVVSNIKEKITSLIDKFKSVDSLKEYLTEKSKDFFIFLNQNPELQSQFNKIVNRNLANIETQAIAEGNEIEDNWDKAHSTIVKKFLGRSLFDELRKPFVIVPVITIWTEVTKIFNNQDINFKSVAGQLIFAILLVVINFFIDHKRFKKDNYSAYEKERIDLAKQFASEKDKFNLRDPRENEFNPSEK